MGKDKEAKDKLVNELIGNPDELAKLIDDYGKMSVWLLARMIAEIKEDSRQLVSKLNQMRGEISELKKRDSVTETLKTNVSDLESRLNKFAEFCKTVQRKN